MMDIGELIGIFMIAGAGAFLCTAVATHMVRHRKREAMMQAEPIGPIRLRTEDGMYRSHFVRRTESGRWVVSAPLRRDSYVPIRIGEKLTAEAPMPGGVILFRTVVSDRDEKTHQLVLEIPAQVHIRERRESERETFFPPKECQLNGQSAELINLSAKGALVKSKRGVLPGDNVNLQLQTGEDSKVGYCLDSEHDTFRGEAGKRTRIVLLENLTLRQ